MPPMDRETETAELLDDALRTFLDAVPFADRGAVMTDLDGTAVHEHEGRIVIPQTVSHALGELRAKGKPAKVALVACMHKMLLIMNAIVRDNTPWSPERVRAN